MIAGIINLNGLRGCDYYEPFAGGAGVALELLFGGTVNSVWLNDADPRIYCFWHAVLNDTKAFARRIFSTPVTIEEWYRQREICADTDGHSTLDLGFAAFFLNRCNRSGVINGAGPIGGLAQGGEWRMGVRFNREELAARVLRIGRLRERVHISGDDGVDFLKSTLPRGNTRGEIFVFLDPPYVRKAKKLYLSFYHDKDHAALSRYLKQQRRLRWLVTYDDCDLVRSLYSSVEINAVPARYSLQHKRIAHELLITPPNLALPHQARHSALQLEF